MADAQPVTKRVRNGAIGPARRDPAGLAGLRRLTRARPANVFTCGSALSLRPVLVLSVRLLDSNRLRKLAHQGSTTRVTLPGSAESAPGG
jgi:hypothetical protein